ncbi:MAG: hypothetical protein JRI25_00770 [Deltaproteobacteria bacterium]|nr:hypothetical protein [Deltaproteobacteria bacterium]MBW2253110.1 hypothetical protein [Deltaproteobacteria bacterium]
MSTRCLSLLPLVALLSACAPSVRVPVLQPAMVDVPGDVRTIGVIDRSRPANLGEGILGALEGALTGEAIMGDREGAESALRTVVATLEESPRYDVVVPNVNKDQTDSGIFDKELDFRIVRRICRRHHCDALLALEAFDSDSHLNIDGDPIDGDKQYTDVTVSRDTRVLAAWRLYDADEDRILDATRDWTRRETWNHHGDTLAEARRGLPSQEYTIRFLGDVMGLDYGARIAPTWFDVTRYYYGKGSLELKEGKHYVRAADWDGARKIWRGLLDDPDRKVRGKAQFNMALAFEVDGALERALEHAKKAAVDLHNGRSREYVRILERRIRDQERLEEQLSAPPATDDAPPRKQKPAVYAPKSNKNPESDESDDDEPATMTRPR